MHTSVGRPPKTWNKLVAAISQVEELKSATEEIKEHMAMKCSEIYSDLCSDCQ